MSNIVALDSAAHAALNAFGATVNGGNVQIFTQSRVTLLATLTLSATAFATAASRAAVINAVTQATAGNPGSAAVAVFRNSSNVEQFSGDVTATGGGGLITFATIANWLAGDTIQVTGGSLTYPA